MSHFHENDDNWWQRGLSYPPISGISTTWNKGVSTHNTTQDTYGFIVQTENPRYSLYWNRLELSANGSPNTGRQMWKPCYSSPPPTLSFGVMSRWGKLNSISLCRECGTRVRIRTDKQVSIRDIKLYCRTLWIWGGGGGGYLMMTCPFILCLISEVVLDEYLYLGEFLRLLCVAESRSIKLGKT
jgi:hypothetical protein